MMELITAGWPVASVALGAMIGGTSHFAKWPWMMLLYCVSVPIVLTGMVWNSLRARPQEWLELLGGATLFAGVGVITFLAVGVLLGWCSVKVIRAVGTR